MVTGMLRFLTEHGLSDGSSVAVPLCGALAPPMDLRATVEAQVIPRLREAPAARLAGAMPSASGSAPLTRPAATPDIDWLAERLARDDGAVAAQIETARTAGLSLERIYLDWLMPAAVRLAEDLAADVRGLAETTLAFYALQSLLRSHADAFCAESGRPESGLRALLVTPAQSGRDPGLPVFALLLMSDFFRRDGWEARAERDMDGAGFRDAVRSEWFDLVEVLADSDHDLDAVASGIRLIRRGSPNPAVGIIACGRPFRERPELARMVGADRSAADPLSSLTQAKLMASRPKQGLLS